MERAIIVHERQNSNNKRQTVKCRIKQNHHINDLLYNTEEKSVIGSTLSNY
jgi:hypothetical protein